MSQSYVQFYFHFCCQNDFDLLVSDFFFRMGLTFWRYKDPTILGCQDARILGFQDPKIPGSKVS